MAQALYRKWRPQTFEEVVDQSHVTQTLRNALADGRVTHAYLFTGPRGTGKTTVARILAKAVNCTASEGEKPCNQCAICRSLTEGRCLDLIEIDAASNRGIDEIRDLREKVHFSPSEATIKTYIIDEVHMLTNEAFNALLKTLEEPPSHVMFILATTEPHRIPATILSRCQRFDFRRIKVKDIVGYLGTIAEQEKLKVESKALQLIARQATGSMRDAISLLDQLVAFGGDEVTLDRVQALLGAVSAEAVEGLVDCLIQRDIAGGLRLINQVVDDGLSPRQLNRQLLEHLRGLLLIQSGGGVALNVTDETMGQMRAQADQLPMDRLVEVIKLFNAANQEMRGSLQIQLPLELAFVEAVIKSEPIKSEQVEPQSSPASERAVTATSTIHERPSPAPVERAVSPPAGSQVAPRESPAARVMKEAQPSSVPAEGAPKPEPGHERGVSSDREGAGQPHSLDQIAEQWPTVLTAIKPRNRNVEALLKDSQPIAVEGRTLVLGFFYSFHKERIEDVRAKGLVEQALSQVMGQPYRIRCVLTSRTPEEIERERPKNKFEEAAEDPVVQAAVKLGGRITDVRMPSEEVR